MGVIGVDTQLREITQNDITRVRNERRLMTTKRDDDKDAQGPSVGEDGGSGDRPATCRPCARCAKSGRT